MQRELTYETGHEHSLGLPPKRPTWEPPPNPGADHVDLDGAPISEVRFRLQRHCAADLQNLRLTCAFFDADGRMVTVPVLDFSEVGLGIAAPGQLVMRAGDVVRDVEVFAGDRRVYRGHATVVHQPTRPDRYGLALSGGTLEVDELKAADQRVGALEEFKCHLSEVGRQLDANLVPEAYRAAVADMASLLVALNAHFGTSAGTLSDVGLTSEELQRVEDAVAPAFSRLVVTMQNAMRGASMETNHLASKYAKRLLHPLLLDAP